MLGLKFVDSLSGYIKNWSSMWDAIRTTTEEELSDIYRHNKVHGVISGIALLMALSACSVACLFGVEPE